MTRLGSLLRLSLLIAAVVLTGLPFLPTGSASANAPGGGSCANDCGCSAGLSGCCLLPNGAECLRAP
jgi:hypothetical protein